MSGVPYPIISVCLALVQHDQSWTSTHKCSHTNTPPWTSVLDGGETSLQIQKNSCSIKGSAGSEKSLRAPSTVYRNTGSTLPSLTSSLSLTLLWITTTLWLSPLSQVSMALQMLQILSRAGAWWSGQPKSNTWGGQRLSIRLRHREERRGCQAYLWIKLIDVKTLLAEVEELKKIRKNKEHNYIACWSEDTTKAKENTNFLLVSYFSESAKFSNTGTVK